MVWNGKKSSLSHLRVFGCDAYVHVPKEKEPCFMVNLRGAYWDGLKGYKIWNLETRKFVYN